MKVPTMPADLNGTEDCLLEVISDFDLNAADKLHVLNHYSTLITNGHFKFFCDQIVFVEDIKEAFGYNL